MKTTFKYRASIHARPYSDDPKFLGVIEANNIVELKEKAKKHARSWNEHGGRLLLRCENTERE
ncbi:MAG: hypothetical protein PHI90_09550, partial [Clostridia bacterium]|nr:hypothetical protein [Clostridia bacterium]